MGAELGDDADLSRGVAEGNELLPKQFQAHGRAIWCR